MSGKLFAVETSISMKSPDLDLTFGFYFIASSSWLYILFLLSFNILNVLFLSNMGIGWAVDSS